MTPIKLKKGESKMITGRMQVTNNSNTTLYLNWDYPRFWEVLKPQERIKKNGK